MDIDRQLEPMVREALAAAVGKDAARFRRAIAAFPNDDLMTKGVRLACALVLYTLDDLFEGRRPSDGEIHDLAADVAMAEAWTEVSSDEVEKFITAAYNGVRVDMVLPLDLAVVFAYVIAANLISSYHADDEQWWDYLDRAEAAIEARPTP